MFQPHSAFGPYPIRPPRQLEEFLARRHYLSGQAWGGPWSANLPSGEIVQGAEIDDVFRQLLAGSINGEATASIFYANIAERLREEGLDQAAAWVREASKDENRHATLLQNRYQELFGTGHKPVIGSTTVEDLKTALTEALGDEFGDARKYRDAYLAAQDPADQRIFFELFTDETRHGTIMTYSLQALR